MRAFPRPATPLWHPSVPKSARYDGCTAIILGGRNVEHPYGAAVVTTIATISVFVCGVNVAFGLHRHNLSAAAGWATAAIWATIAAWGGTA